MGDQIEVFIEKFQQLEKLLKQASGSSDEERLPSVLKKVADHNAYVSKNYSLILDLNSLRNVFAHQGRGKYIANINDFVLKKLLKLIKALENPPSVTSKFNQNVYQAKTTDFIASVMNMMREKVYTHVPVWENQEFVGVFSYTSFFEWLAERQNEGIKSISFTKRFMDDINKKYLNPPNVNFQFIGELKNLYEIPSIFEEATKKQERLDCLFITKNGKKGEKIKGIITSWDLGTIQ